MSGGVLQTFGWRVVPTLPFDGVRYQKGHTACGFTNQLLEEERTHEL
jgi:hypothetical protein